MDFRKLNSKTVKDANPIPRIQDNLDSLNGAQWFSSLDCDGLSSNTTGGK